MRIRALVIACALVVILGPASRGIDIVAAEPSAFCRNLAATFWTAPEQLDARSLARLGACVITEIEERVGATEPSMEPDAGAAPSPPPAAFLPPPVPSDAMESPVTRRYGDWPPPATWIGNWPSPTAW